MKFKRGWYKHYKGKLYFVDIYNDDVVNYYNEYHELISQSYDEFFKEIKIDNKIVSKFEYVGEKIYSEI